MTMIEEVKKMQQQGLSDEQIIQTLRERGIDYREIADSLAQSRIKAAVEQPDMEPNAPYPGSQSGGEGMEPSIMTPQVQEIPAPSPGENYGGQAPVYGNPQIQDYNQPGYPPQEYANYGPSQDTTTEIAEQIVAERLGDLRKHLEKIADMKTTVEAKIEYLDDRLKRIEKVMDNLQSSVLRKVGDYITNVDDIKKELIETQKTFGKLLPEIKKETESIKHHKHQAHQHNQSHEQHEHHSHSQHNHKK